MEQLKRWSTVIRWILQEVRLQ